MECISGDDCFMKLDNDSYIFFYFTAKWCGPCKILSPQIEKLSNIIDDSIIKIYKIDIDDENNEEICNKCLIKSVPTSIIFKNRTSKSIINGNDINKILLELKNLKIIKDN